MLVNSNTISYRVQIIDGYQTTNIVLGTINFYYKNVLGFNSGTSITLSDILGFTNSVLSNGKIRTITGVTSGINYTYYCYASSAGDLTSCIMDGAAPILGALTKLSDISGVNSYGANVTYRIYRTNASNAFSNNSLAFS